MKEAKQVITYATVSLVFYCAVSLLMYGQTNTSFLSAEVVEHLGIAIALYLVVAVMSGLNLQIAVYVTLFVLLIYTIALVGAFFQINYHSDAGSVMKVIVDVLSVIGLVFNVICAVAAIRLRTSQSNFKFKRK